MRQERHGSSLAPRINAGVSGFFYRAAAGPYHRRIDFQYIGDEPFIFGQDLASVSVDELNPDARGTAARQAPYLQSAAMISTGANIFLAPIFLAL
ncbi:MAG: hypothetical protein GPOALKHO_001474 [Sodalis sp.]|nr:MAG: hypothetical protein GPOALKHO_001474 [Sodalis sp.]